MEFLKALREAAKMGISKGEFIPIWEKEMGRRPFTSQTNLEEDVKPHSKQLDTDITAKQLAGEIQSLKAEARQLRLEIMTLRTDIFNENTELIKNTISQCLAQHLQDLQTKCLNGGEEINKKDNVKTLIDSMVQTEVIKEDSKDSKNVVIPFYLSYFTQCPLYYFINLKELESQEQYKKIALPTFKFTQVPCTVMLFTWLEDGRLKIDAILYGNDVKKIDPNTNFVIVGKIYNKNSNA